MNNLRIKISHSSSPIPSKPSNPMAIKFISAELSVSEFCNKIEDSFAFCHDFNVAKWKNYFTCTDKNLNNFKGSDVIFLDIDDTHVTPQELSSQLQDSHFSPLLIYTTYNHKKKGKAPFNNRYRIVYRLKETITDTNAYTHCVNLIEAKINTINPNIKVDKQAKSAAQAFYGYGTENEDKFISRNYDSVIVDYNDIAKQFPTVKKLIRYYQTPQDTSTLIKDDELRKTILGDINNRAFNLQDEVERRMFITKFSKYYIPNHSDYVNSDEEFAWLKKPYYEVKRRYKTYYDRQGRKNKLRWWGITRRLINPYATFDEILVTLVFDCHNYICMDKVRTVYPKNSECFTEQQEVLTIDNLIYIAKKIISTDMKDIDIKPKFEFCMPTAIKPKRGWQSRMKKWQNEQIIKTLTEEGRLDYDNFKMECEKINLKPIKEKTFKDCYIYGRNFVMSMSKQDLISKHYDKNIKAADCYRLIVEKYGNTGIKLPTKRTVERYYNRMQNIFKLTTENTIKTCINV